jgi:oligopeptide transport system substrate-binding protein
MKFITLLFAFSLLPSVSQAFIWNSPYSEDKLAEPILMSSFSSPPKHLDPVVSYNSNEWQFLSQVYEPPFQYHYFKVPYEMEPLTLTGMPTLRYMDLSGQVLPKETRTEEIAFTEYHFQLKAAIEYQPHPCFVKSSDGALRYQNLTEADLEGIETPGDFAEQASRNLTAADYVYAIKRMAVRKNHSPILDAMTQYIVGLKDYSKIASKQKLPTQWIRQNDIEGIEVLNDREFTLRIHGVYPQFLYWMTMNFFAPIPWEAEDFFNQDVLHTKNIKLDTYPVGTGPYMLVENNPNKLIRLAKNPNYRQDLFPEISEQEIAASPFPEQLKQMQASVGQPLPFIESVEYHLEKESVPLWNKFLQGYYDASGVSSDSFDQAMSVGSAGDLSLTDSMREQNIQFVSSVMPTLYYFAFNMVDPVVGGYSEKQQKLRQAISIALNFDEYVSIFRNGQGEAGQGPIPPGLYGYQPGEAGVNPYIYDWVNGRAQRKSLDDAKQLLVEAGYPNGLKTDGTPLTLNFDSSQTGPDAQAQLNWMRKQFAKLGIELVIRATDYNRFQDKVRGAKTQMFMWGWNADYPDPENFLFLLAGENASIHTEGGGVNSANYDRPEFNQMFQKIKTLENGEERAELIQKMVAMVQKDAPWAWGFYPKGLVLYHHWYQNVFPNPLVNNGLKYKRIDAQARLASVQQWNHPILWPLILFVVLVLGSVVPLWRAYGQRQTRQLNDHQGR